MASFIACIWTQNFSSALTALCCCWTLNTVEPLSVTAAWSRVVSTSAAIFFITNWWMSKSLKVWIMTWKLARSKPGRGRAEMQGSSVPLGRNHVSPSGGPLPSWALRIVLTFPPFTAPLIVCVFDSVPYGLISNYNRFLDGFKNENSDRANVIHCNVPYWSVICRFKWSKSRRDSEAILQRRVI